MDAKELLKYCVDNHEWCERSRVERCETCKHEIRCEDTGDCDSCKKYLEATRIVYGESGAKELQRCWAEAREYKGRHREDGYGR